MTESPSHCLRGIRKKDFLVEDASALHGAAFEPDPRTSEHRAGGAAETSINWEDDARVLTMTLRNQQLAAHGVARLPRTAIEDANHLPNLATLSARSGERGLLFHERAPLPDNPHHGNILFARELPKPLMRLLAGYLAMHAEYIAP